MSIFSFFERFIPPPEYMLMPSIGVDISDTSLKYIEFGSSTHNGIQNKLTAWGEITIPNGVLERGMVLDQKKLEMVLRELKKRTKAEHIRVSLPEERAYLFETEIKRSTLEKEVRDILEFRLEENVPIPAREAFFDYDILEGETTDNTLRVVVAAYARETILNYYDACVEAELTPVSFEVEAQAMARAVLPTDSRGSHLLVDFGKTRTGVGIVHDGVLMYTSTIDFGGNELSVALRKELGNLSEAELTKIKNVSGLIKGVSDSRCYESLIYTVSVIKDELSNRIQYWHARDYKQRDRQIKSIVLCGGSSNLNGLPEYLTESLGISTSRANVWQNAFTIEAFIPPIDLLHSYGYATAVGLALKRTI